MTKEQQRAYREHATWVPCDERGPAVPPWMRETQTLDSSTVDSHAEYREETRKQRRRDENRHAGHAVTPSVDTHAARTNGEAEAGSVRLRDVGVKHIIARRGNRSARGNRR